MWRKRRFTPAKWASVTKHATSNCGRSAIGQPSEDGWDKDFGLLGNLRLEMVFVEVATGPRRAASSPVTNAKVTRSLAVPVALLINARAPLADFS